MKNCKSLRQDLMLCFLCIANLLLIILIGSLGWMGAIPNLISFVLFCSIVCPILSMVLFLLCKKWNKNGVALFITHIVCFSIGLVFGTQILWHSITEAFSDGKYHVILEVLKSDFLIWLPISLLIPNAISALLIMVLLRTKSNLYKNDVSRIRLVKISLMHLSLPIMMIGVGVCHNNIDVFNELGLIPTVGVFPVAVSVIATIYAQTRRIKGWISNLLAAFSVLLSFCVSLLIYDGYLAIVVIVHIYALIASVISGFITSMLFRKIEPISTDE